MQSTRWVFTLNNPTQDEISTLSHLPQCATYLVFGEEVGASGTPHLQGFIIFSSRKRLSSVRQIVGTRAHCETAKGTSQQARAYCCKDGKVTECGVLPLCGQGRRSDLDAFLNGQPSSMENMDALLLLPTLQSTIPQSSRNSLASLNASDIDYHLLDLSPIRLNFEDGSPPSSMNYQESQTTDL